MVSDVRRCPVCGDPMEPQKKSRKLTYFCNNPNCDVIEVRFEYVAFADMPDKATHLKRRGVKSE